MRRLQEIRARLTVLEDGHAVHVPCGGEAGFSCRKCGAVPSDEVIAPGTVSEDFVAADIRYLLELFDAKGAA